MKVSELIAELQQMDPDAEVWLQKDEEGNGFKSASGAEPGVIAYGEEFVSNEADPEDFELTVEQMKNLRASGVKVYP